MSVTPDTMRSRSGSERASPLKILLLSIRVQKFSLRSGKNKIYESEMTTVLILSDNNEKGDRSYGAIAENK